MTDHSAIQQTITPIKKINLKVSNFFKTLKEAIAGSEQDYTAIPLNKAVFLLAIPMVLEMVMESVFAIVDIFFVSRLGADAVAIVGITESMLTVVYAIAFGLSMGTTALVSRRIGEKNYFDASIDGLQAIITGFIISFMIALPGLLFAKELLMLMGASESLAEQYYYYPAIMFGSNIVIMMLFINNAIFRGAGDAAISMKVLWIANGINLVLDPLLIFGIGPFPELGVAGAAVATTTGRGIGVLYQFYILYRDKSRISFRTISFKIDGAKIVHLINLSLGGIFQMLIATSSWVFLVRIISSFGSQVVAAYTIAIRIIIFSLLPSWGMSNAAATLVGQNLGANRPDRAEKAVWGVVKINVGFLGIVGLIFFFLPHFFMKLFTTEPELVSIGSSCLKIVAIGFIMYGAGMVLTQAFNGAGDTRTPTKVNLLGFWMIEIPLAYALANIFGFGYHGVFWAIVIAESCVTLFALYFFLKGNWKTQKV